MLKIVGISGSLKRTGSLNTSLLNTIANKSWKNHVNVDFEMFL
jgi:hypothetical protein